MYNTSFTSSLLQQAEIDIKIETPLAITRLTQTFVNQTKEIIEAVYSFPVPRQAVIMQVVITINGEVFTGQVKPVTEAEDFYEEGIEEGKRSVLIRDIGDGQHEIRAGNLATEDCLVIQIQIAQLMQGQTGGYRYFLPTVIAPKYGHAMGLNDVSHQHSILANYPFTAQLQVKNNTGVHCVSHCLTEHNKGYQFAGALDQDIVLMVASNYNTPYTISALHGDYPCSLSILPPQAKIETTFIASIVLLIDCSGSMTGLSMQQTKAGLTAMLNELQEGSEVSLMCFGCDVLHVNPKPFSINAKTRNVLLEYVSKIDADMGGTEIWNALTAAQLQGKKHIKTPEIILLTDGRVWDNSAYCDNVKTPKPEQCRINTIGVGSAVSEDIVIQMAEATNGQWILVHPNEPMGERVSHFIAQTCAPRHSCLWQTTNTLWTALPSVTSEVHGGVGYVVYEQGAIAKDLQRCEITLNDVILPQIQLSSELGLALQKLVAQQHIHTLDETKATDLSIKLGLVNSYTSFVMVTEKTVKNADGLPKLEVVPQMAQPTNVRVHACVSFDYHEQRNEESRGQLSLPRFLRRENIIMNESDVHLECSSTLSLADDSFISLVLTKADKKFKRTLLKGRMPSLKLLMKWGLDQDLADAIQEYFTQQHITKTQYYIATVLLWLNERQDILSETSIDLLQHQIDKALPAELLGKDMFIQMLDEADEWIC